ncbi:NAD(P)H-dependent oxidoreductase subunit E [uncultured Thiothrix sp.]|jgi:NADH-quinone oxidoreductase subunit E|uniref:NADH-quinone oxidoreductase subunit NuoE family protein n=1 Tax=uncultured Thiothrix sp. TaxID=223185 RepID=UPI00261308B8|nr:NAD(P)H-dependent oxidoreductase subunit E [uncultured Thiothrix sp.]HMT93107.1 NAD(P)H-dependent oxidoreductase subunit E [Thiolinea sp.]
MTEYFNKNPLSRYERETIDSWLRRYPSDKKQSALLAALHAVMHEDHYVSTEKMDAIAAYLSLPPIAIYEVASFYSMYELNEQAAARYNISVCTNISCMLCGSDQILAHIERKLGVNLGQTTDDGKFFLKKEEECLAACSYAPMMQINHVYHTDLTPEKVDQILDGLE